MTLSTAHADLPPGETSLLSDLARALGFHRWLIALVAIGTLATTYGAFQFVSDQYESSARLLVKLGRENVELPVTVEKGGLLSTGVRREEINTEIQLISSRPLLETVVDRLGLDAFKLEAPPPVSWLQRVKHQVRQVVKWARAQVKEALIALNLRPRLTEREEVLLLLTNTLRVEREKDSDVITVAIRLPSPDLAMKVVDSIVMTYLDRRVDVRRERGMSSFFDEQLEALRTKLQGLDETKQRLRNTRNISAISEERSLLMTRLQTFYAQTANDQRELQLLMPDRKATTVGSVPTRLASASSDPVSPLVPPGPVEALSSYPNLEQLRAKLTELRLRRVEQLQRFTDGSEPVQRIDREIGRIETTLRQAITAQLGDRRNQAQSIEQRLSQLNSGEVALEVIERDRAVLAQNYQSYAKRREDARVSEALDLRRVSNIAVMSAAERPIEPVGPKKLLTVALALPFGLLAGLFLALFLEYLNQTIRDERDLPGTDHELYLGSLILKRRP